ncbi:MAG: hypothetical protein GX245_02415 [Eubacteriaceae bacterium]|nr:hypothetical protein [Eubacteriaceae bacterium]
MKRKRILSAIIIIIFLLVMMPLPVFAASSSLSGPSTVQKGDVITVAFVISGMNEAYGIQGSVQYSSDTLTCEGVSPGGSVNYNGTTSPIRFVAEKSDGTFYPSSFQVATMRFTVKGNAGSTISISTNGVMISVKDGENYVDQAVSGASYSRTITAPPPPSTPTTPSAPSTPSAPKSTNADLASLTATNAQIVPSFSASTTAYRASVGFEVSSLNISARAADSNAKVAVYNNSLQAGGTTDVRVVVTAPAGNSKTYVIKTTREADPNYVASGNNYITGITIDKGILSPPFHRDITHYVIWLPYESESIAVSATAEDPRATVEITGGESLIAGADNMVNIVCTGENGLKKEYSIVVKRASPLGGGDKAVNLVGVDGAMAQFERLAAAKSGKTDDNGEKITANKDILLDLSNSASKQVPRAIFEELQKHSDATLTINVGYAKIVFRGKDIKTTLDKEYYDFAYFSSSEYENIMRQQAKDETDGMVFSFAHNDNLPGYATFYLMTNFVQGEKYNLYKYRLEDEKFYLIAKNVSIGPGGLMAYYNDTCSDYILTKQVIEGAVRYDSVSKQGKVASVGRGLTSNILITTWVAGIGLILGFVFGIAIPKRKGKKQAETGKQNLLQPVITAGKQVLKKDEKKADSKLVGLEVKTQNKATATKVQEKTDSVELNKEVDKEFHSLLKETDKKFQEEEIKLINQSDEIVKVVPLGEEEK